MGEQRDVAALEPAEQARRSAAERINIDLARWGRPVSLTWLIAVSVKNLADKSVGTVGDAGQRRGHEIVQQIAAEYKADLGGPDHDQVRMFAGCRQDCIDGLPAARAAVGEKCESPDAGSRDIGDQPVDVGIPRLHVGIENRPAIWWRQRRAFRGAGRAASREIGEH